MNVTRPFSLAILCALSAASCSDDAGSTSSTDAARADVVDVLVGEDAGADDAAGADAAIADVADEDGGQDTAGVDATGEDATGEDATGEDATVPPSSCLADLFIQPDPHPANSAYPDPALSATCDNGELNVQSNGIIGFPFVAITPNALSAQDWSWTVPVEPTWLDEPVDIPLLGVAGFTTTGLPFYGPNEGPMPDPFGDPVYNAIVDDCQGHTGPTGDYHAHALVVSCMVAAAAGERSPIIAVALDGYPIYGPMGCIDAACETPVEMQSGWVQIGDPSTYAWDAHEFTEDNDPVTLDQCNGHFGPDGDYHYHATATFPYILGCYHGDAAAAAGGGGGQPGTPTTCASNADCDGACNGGLDCVCNDTPRGMICVPTCETAADCGADFTCNAGFCRPTGGPGGG